MLDTDIDQIVQWLKQGDNATTICANLNLCPGPLCGTCALVFGVLDEILPSGAGEVGRPSCACYVFDIRSRFVTRSASPPSSTF